MILYTLYTLYMLSPLILIVIYFVISRNVRVDLSKGNIYHKRFGIECFNCSDPILTDISEIIKAFDRGDPKLCKVCSRESKLNRLLFFDFIWFNRIVLSKRFDKIFLGIAITSSIVSIILFLLLKINTFVLSATIYNLYWSFIIYRHIIGNRHKQTV